VKQNEFITMATEETLPKFPVQFTQQELETTYTFVCANQLLRYRLLSLSQQLKNTETYTCQIQYN